MGSINKHISRYEITAVFTHPDAKVDIILVHGLNGDPKQTWTAKHGGVFWPTDLLPESLRNVHANVLVYGYNADVYSSRNNRADTYSSGDDRSASDNFIYQHAQTLVTHLTLYRKGEGTSTNPIIWVAHSLGGLLVKNALLYSNDIKDKNHEDARAVFISTYGIVFLGTPHTGSGLAAWATVLQAMSDAVMPRKLWESESVLLKTLKKDNETLKNINSHFLDVYQRFKIHMAHENHKTDLKGTKMVVVDANSASPPLPGVTYYGIEASHSNMCKFDNASAPGYRNVSTALREWAADAPSVIQTRWGIEREDRRARAQHEAAERTREYSTPIIPYSSDSGTSHVPQASPFDTASTLIPSQQGSFRGLLPLRQPLFIHPDHFRPNSFFKGREEELRELHRMLADPNRRSEGTSAVLVQGIPGAGKTHLARQYVFNHKDDYPGGIYWIRSTTLQDMEEGFWRIAKSEAIREMVDQTKENDLSDPRKMVEIVRNWFNDFEGWLLIFDGIRFDDPDVRKFIPDRKDSALIFTSTERTVTASHLLDNPSVMELGLLSAQDAQELLLEEMGRKRPHTRDDLKRAMELVQLMDRLPLMIHAAAQQMNATREPLAKYLKSFRDKPRVGMLPAYKTIRDQLQHRGETSALNLMYILSFFSQLIPVEMLALGLKALDKRTPIKTDASGQKSLNGTFVTLIKFALIERNEMDDIASSSSRSSRQNVSIAEPLDVLRIHSIVQAFFIELLSNEKQLAFWLERATSIFCLSFDAADSRMKGDQTTGLPDDYRRYIIHGKKLLEHLDRHCKSKEAKRSGIDLVAVRGDLKERLDKLPGEIDVLQRIISTSIIDGGEVAEHSSVFERTSSWSSHSTDKSNGAGFPDHGRLLGEESVQSESPVNYYNPHQFHVPYPPSLIESQYSQDESQFTDDKTVIPPDTADGPMTDAGESAWTLVPKHRSVKKLQKRRYHDRGGAWRETAGSVNDPRTSISRESARGLISPPVSSRGGRSPSRSRMSARSEAELELLHIKQVSPPPPRGGGYIQDKGSRSSSTGTGARPWPPLGRSSYADVLSGTAFYEETPTTPSFARPPSRAGTLDRTVTYDALSVNSLRTVDTTATSFLSGMLHRRKENQASAGQPAADHQDVRPPSPAWYSTKLLKSLRRTSDEKSKGPKKPPASSTPQPSQRSPTTYQGGTRTANSSPGAQFPPFYPPGLQIITNNASSLRNDCTNQQSPQSQSQPCYPQDLYQETLSWSDPNLGHPAVNVSSPATTAAMSPVYPPPAGYTSQPMSRNPSSNPPIGGATGSSDTPYSSNSGSIRSSLAYPRAPSIVETEPSPQLQPVDMNRTSYQAWTRRHHQRGDSLFGGSNVPASRWQPTAQPPTFEARDSPDLGRSRTSSQASAGGESMSRTGSGGIHVGDGRIIAFGEVPVDIESGRQRVQENLQRLERDAATDRPPDDSKPVVGLGISSLDKRCT